MGVQAQRGTSAIHPRAAAQAARARGGGGSAEVSHASHGGEGDISAGKMTDKDDVKEVFRAAKSTRDWEVFQEALEAAMGLKQEAARSFALLRALVGAGFARREAAEMVYIYLQDALAQKYAGGEDEVSN